MINIRIFLIKVIGNIFYILIFKFLILPELIHSFIISLLFSPMAASSLFEVVPLILSLFNCTFQNSGRPFSVSILISSIIGLWSYNPSNSRGEPHSLPRCRSLPRNLHKNLHRLQCYLDP